MLAADTPVPQALPLAASNKISRSCDSARVIEAIFMGKGSLSGGISLNAATVDTKLKEHDMVMERSGVYRNLEEMRGGREWGEEKLFLKEKSPQFNLFSWVFSVA